MKSIILLLIFCFTLFCNCNDEKEELIIPKLIEFYMLESYETMDNSCAIDEKSAVISDLPLLTYSELESYDAVGFKFKLVSDPESRIFDHNDFSLHKEAFAVCADKQLIYTGYFWAAYSSLSCDWTVIDPINYGERNELRLSSLYPGFMIKPNKAKQYNDERILSAFRRDGKLIE